MSTSLSILKAFSRLASALVFSALFAGAAHAAPTLTVEAGQLTGATGVDVGGTLYDVQFFNGNCSALFSGCDSVGDFVFQTDVLANAASLALLNLAFVDGASGDFDSSPEQTFGCQSDVLCRAITPYMSEQFGRFLSVSVAYNYAANSGFLDYVAIDNTLDANSGPFIDGTWAIWSVNDPLTVPEPSSLALLGLAGVALGWSQRRRRLRANALAQ